MLGSKTFCWGESGATGYLSPKGLGMVPKGGSTVSLSVRESVLTDDSRCLPMGNSAFGYCTAPHRTTPHQTIPHRTILHRTTTRHTASHRAALHLGTLYCTAPPMLCYQTIYGAA